MKRNHFLWSVIAIMLVSLVSCAPKTAPVPSQPAPVAPSPAPVPASNAPAPTSQDAAWAKVVEAAKKEGKVTAYSYTWVGDAGLAISRGFKDRYGITLDIVTGRGAEFIERLKTEKRVGQIVGDVTEGSSLHVANMKQEGVLTSVADQIPALREKGVWIVDPTAIDKEKMNLVWRVIAFTPYINTNLVKGADIPKSWKDLLDPRWKNAMTFTEPNVSAGPYQYMVVLMDNKAWDEEYVKALYKQGLRTPTGLQEETLMLARGEIKLSVRGSDASAGRFALEGAPIQAIDMKEGVVLSTASVAAVAGSPSPNAARLLLDWIYSKEGITIAGKAQGNKMVRKDVPDFRPSGVQTDMAKPLVETPEHLEKAAQLFRQKWYDKLVGR
ncbi:MAG: extracellular solute-binding protein [Chloroflexi bacterium]|nr:extracellular solute-binding protein [Chloroflexota bacterium]